MFYLRRLSAQYKTHSNTGKPAGVRYVHTLIVPGIQSRAVTALLEAFSGHKTGDDVYIGSRVCYFYQFETRLRS